MAPKTFLRSGAPAVRTRYAPSLRPGHARFLVGGLIAALAASLSPLLNGCGGAARPGPRVEPEWRLVPEGTALGERRQFFLYGRRLDSASVSAPPSVRVERGEARAGGRALPLYLTVSPMGAGVPGESAGSREIRVKTADTALVFTLKVVDEADQR